VGGALRLLLDTRTLLWALEGGQRLSQRARDEILKLENEVLVSIASAWEMAHVRPVRRRVNRRFWRDPDPEGARRGAPVS
jgi:hypothetical protein